MAARTPESTGQCKTVRQRSGAETVLLTNACGPYPNKWGKSPTDLLGARLARDNNMDGRARLHTFALYLLAENVKNPCTVLEYPGWEDFIREVHKGYDVVAIQLHSMHMARVARMMKVVRQISPETEIVIGGNGVGMLHEPLPGDKDGHAVYIRETADHLCRTEGVRFMRELLDDPPFDRPITQYSVPPADIRVTGPGGIHFAMPAILVSLGCPQACEFCNTSAFYRYKKIRVATPEQVYDCMKSHQRRLGRDAITFILFDEDIFLDPEFVRELGRLIRSDERTWGFRWISFGSISTVSKLSPRELRECGVEGIWIGVETSIRENDRSKTGYRKREGVSEPHELFPELTRWGIQTIGSMILGFDFHTRDNIEQDIDYFVDLKPTLYQVGPFRPCPGTKLYWKMRKQGRINELYDWEDIHLWEEGSFKLENLQSGDIRKYYDLAHEKLRTRNGPPLLQIFECEIRSYETLQSAGSDFLRYQARRAVERMRLLRFVARAIELDPPSPRVKERARYLLEQSEPILKENASVWWKVPGVAAVVDRVAPHVVRAMRIIGTVQSTPYTTPYHSPPTRRSDYRRPGRETPSVPQIGA